MFEHYICFKTEPEFTKSLSVHKWFSKSSRQDCANRSLLLQKYYHHCHHEWTFIKRISFKSNAVKKKDFCSTGFVGFSARLWQQPFAHTYSKIITIWYQRSENLETNLWRPQFFQKTNEKKMPLGPQVKFFFAFRSFFGRIENTTICFRDFLTFITYTFPVLLLKV